MNQVKLVRFGSTPHGVFSELITPEGFKCYTVERPWIHNERNVSCIPAGDYPLVFGHFYKGGYDCWEVRDVPGRSDIKIHIANRASEVMGCIAPGTSLGALGQVWSVLSSRVAFDGLMAALDPGIKYELQIRWFAPEIGKKVLV